MTLRSLAPRVPEGRGRGRGRASASLRRRCSRGRPRPPGRPARAGAGVPARRRGRPEPLRAPRRRRLLRAAAGHRRPPGADGVRDLDGFFGLHPALAALAELYSEGLLALHPTIGNAQLSRSHFDAQDFMDTGAPGDKTVRDGWLERVARQVPGDDLMQLVALSSRDAALRARPASRPRRRRTSPTFAVRAGSGAARPGRAEAGPLLREVHAGGGDRPAQSGRGRLRRHRPFRDHTRAACAAAERSRLSAGPGRHRPAAGRAAHQGRPRDAVHLRQRARRVRHPRQPAAGQQRRATRARPPRSWPSAATSARASTTCC